MFFFVQYRKYWSTWTNRFLLYPPFKMTCYYSSSILSLGLFNATLFFCLWPADMAHHNKLQFVNFPLVPCGEHLPHRNNPSWSELWQNWQEGCWRKKRKRRGKKKLCNKSNVLILCHASGLRSSPQTFINPPRAIKGGIRGPKETKSWWIELISTPMMDGPVHRGLQNRSIVHLSLRLPCPTMICTPVVKATSGQKTSLSSPSSSTSLCVSPLPRNSHSSSFLGPPPPLTRRSCSQMHKTTRAAKIISRHTCRHE